MPCALGNCQLCAVARPYPSGFAEAKDSTYLVVIRGSNRTADIELTVTLGVHGPKDLYVWMMDEYLQSHQ